MENNSHFDHRMNNEHNNGNGHGQNDQGNNGINNGNGHGQNDQGNNGINNGNGHGQNDQGNNGSNDGNGHGQNDQENNGNNDGNGHGQNDQGNNGHSDDESEDLTDDSSDDDADNSSENSSTTEEVEDKTPYGFTSSTGWSEYKDQKSFLGMKVVTKQLYSITNGGKCSITLGSDTTLVGGSKLLIKGLAWSKHAHLGYHFSGSFATLSWSNDANDVSFKSQKLAAEKEKLEAVTFKAHIEEWESKVSSQTALAHRIMQVNSEVGALGQKLGTVSSEFESTQFKYETGLIRKKVLVTKIQNVTQDCQTVAQSTDQCANALEKVFFNVNSAASVDIEDKKLILM
ncbi:hypothetical protein [Shewanella surugensis]|uniref:Uncharacterized protein n=1 Tax=Shewanella surugensis TaxID=212020 RepID=A0ABT0L709_9GAMM|nr:hypothetical protein [Shewanella surugensis]MCL1123473.1 hypothetical protein [Shewanella surugensis]